MPHDPSTLEQSSHSSRSPGTAPRPGLLVAFSDGAPLVRVLTLPPISTSGEGVEVDLGRGDAYGVPADPRISRRHARVRFAQGRVCVQDLGSQNGTVVDGRPVAGGAWQGAERVLRLGDTLILVCKDVQPLIEQGVKLDGGRVMGPSTQAALADVVRAARLGSTLHIHGESGTGKESLAAAFHQAGPGGRLVAVNCAAIPQGVAERLFFGTRRGAYSGADSDAEGYLHAADGGTLFLDEVGDLDPQVQPKLLRVLESGEFWQLGAARPRTVSLCVVSATHRDLRGLAAAGRFREDLFFRIGRPAVEILPLRRRPEEVPWLVATHVGRLAPNLAVHASLIEACLLRPWPGNVRELLVELRAAVHTALADGGGRLDGRHLEPSAGTAFAAASAPSPLSPLPPAPLPEPEPRGRPLDPAERARLEAALRAHSGNVSAAARALGLHRTQLRRLLQRYGVDPHSYSESAATED